MDNSPASPAALRPVVDGITEKARGGEQSFHVVRFDPEGDAVDPGKEREFTGRDEMREWIGARPDRDVIFVVRYRDE